MAEPELPKICFDRILEKEALFEARRLAVRENPANAGVMTPGGIPGFGVPPGFGMPPGFGGNIMGVALKACLWKPGRVLRVRFLDGDQRVQARVIGVAKEWERYANIKFAFGNDPNAEIRISFTADRGSWSFCGADCLAIPADRPTMNLGWLQIDTSDEEYTRVVLHEFGHALGLAHEHQNPATNIPWNKPAVYRAYAGPPNNWTPDKVEINLFKTYSVEQTQFTEFDRRSIMLYPVPKELTDGVFEVGWNSKLSDTDKAFIGSLYPFETFPVHELIDAEPGGGPGGKEVYRDWNDHPPKNVPGDSDTPRGWDNSPPRDFPGDSDTPRGWDDNPPKSVDDADVPRGWDDQPIAGPPGVLGGDTAKPPPQSQADKDEGSKNPVVNTGFAPQDDPDSPIDKEWPLQTNRDYYFLLHIGEKKDWDIARRDIKLPTEKLPPKARLQVVLFAFENEFELTTGQDMGELELQRDRSVIVKRRAARFPRLKDRALLKDHLFFPVRTPANEGICRLRCNIYYKQVLVQSYLVQAQVVSPKKLLTSRRAGKQALETILDYTLSNTLDAKNLVKLGEHRLSMMINDNGNGTHGFRLFGADGKDRFKSDASFSFGDLQNMITSSRAAMRFAAWGKEQEFNEKQDTYLYTNLPGGRWWQKASWLKKLHDDLVSFALEGSRFYFALRAQIAEHDAQSSDEIRQKKLAFDQMLSKPGVIQIASRENLRAVLPAAMIYDHRLETSLPFSSYSLCPAFLDALESGAPLADSPCFQGDCPSRDNLTVVCPSGFWGYRHIISMPPSIGPTVEETETRIKYSGAPSFAAAFSTDFTLRKAHLQNLKALKPGMGWSEADSGLKTRNSLAQNNFHIFYFYCHGGLNSQKLPYLQVGGKDDDMGIITPAFLPSRDIYWSKPRPLIFINGCHTTALEPEAAMDLVSSFVREAHAAGVIGAEITNFEPLAVGFAEECLRHFLNSVPIGESIRRARLALLARGNPLGLIYIPFVMSSLALVKE